MIRCGADASSDQPRRCAPLYSVRMQCATIQHPSRVDTDAGFQAFPTCYRNQASRQTVAEISHSRMLIFRVGRIVRAAL